MEDSNAGKDYYVLIVSLFDQIYISLEGVDQEKVEKDFKQLSFDVKFHDVNGKNYRFTIPKLNKEIVPEKCKILVKPARVIVTLVKASKGNWLDLQFKEDKVISFNVSFVVLTNTGDKC